MCGNVRESFFFSTQGCYLLEILHFFFLNLSLSSGRQNLSDTKERGGKCKTGWAAFERQHAALLCTGTPGRETLGRRPRLVAVQRRRPSALSSCKHHPAPQALTHRPPEGSSPAPLTTAPANLLASTSTPNPRCALHSPRANSDQPSPSATQQ